MADKPKNIAASVRQRLANLSRAKKRDFGLILVSFGLERLIFRLSQSAYRDRFVLKGGMLYTVWAINDDRTTRDADFAGFGEFDEAQLKATFAEIMAIDADDGLLFDIANLTAAAIREDQIYGGVRLKTVALLGNARIPITIDIGLGDALTEPDHTIDYPSLLGDPIANVRAYPPAAVIAEKLQAIVALGIANGRMKDYYDLWAIPAALDIEAEALDAAIAATFARRGTPIPITAPPGLTDAFSNDPQKRTQWTAYANSVGVEGVALERIVGDVWAHLAPSCLRLNRG